MIADRLRRRVRAGGADPLVTYYDLASGERTELSATSFLLWVDKTSNLLADDYLLQPGATVDLELARFAPGHWVTLAVTLAAWQVGATVRVGGSGHPPAELLVVGPDWAEADLERGEEVLACSLHPLGLGFAESLPSRLADFSVEVRGQSDVHSPSPRTVDEPAWVDEHRRLSQGELDRVEVVAPDLVGPGALRRLAPVTDPWSSTRDGLVVPLLTGGSAVLVRGEDPDRVARIGRDERVEG